MRYYDIRITKNGNLIRPASLKSAGIDTTFTSWINNRSVPGALNVEMDFPITTFDTPRYGSRLSVWGLSLAELAQGFDLNGCNITVRAGFKPGLPLATAAAKYAGIVLQGTIFQAFGNWIDSNQKIDMILMPPTGTTGSPVNIQFKSQANQPMNIAIKQALASAFPKYTVQVAVSDQFVFNYEQTANYSLLSSFAKWIKELSQAQQFKGIKTVSGMPYDGVSIAIRGTTINVFDGTSNYGNYTPGSPAQLAFQDMIGQPTWINPTTINFKTPMRADLNVGDYLKMPEKLAAPYVLQAPGAAIPNSPATAIRNTIQFQGKYMVIEVHHFGNFRQDDAASWCTTFDCVIVNPPTTGS